MSEHARALIELMGRPWTELDPAERAIFDDWMAVHSKHLLTRGANLYLLLDFARARWARPRHSSSQTFEAIKETEEEK